METCDDLECMARYEEYCCALRSMDTDIALSAGTCIEYVVKYLSRYLIVFRPAA